MGCLFPKASIKHCALAKGRVQIANLPSFIYLRAQAVDQNGAL